MRVAADACRVLAQHLAFWGTIATLVVSVYKGYGTIWYVIAFTVINLLRLFGVRKSTNGPLFSLPALLISGARLHSCLGTRAGGASCCSSAASVYRLPAPATGPAPAPPAASREPGWC